MEREPCSGIGCGCRQISEQRVYQRCRVLLWWFAGKQRGIRLDLGGGKDRGRVQLSWNK